MTENIDSEYIESIEDFFTTTSRPENEKITDNYRREVDFEIYDKCVDSIYIETVEKISPLKKTAAD